MRTVLHTLLVSLLILGASSGLKVVKLSTFQSSDDDKIYTIKEVDVRAKVKNQREHLPAARKDCPENVRVSLTAVLRKTGKVTDVTIRRSSGCSYDQDAINAVLQFKFDPAIKDGKQVSQYTNVEFTTTTR